VNIVSVDEESANAAIEIVKSIVKEVEVGAVYEGKVRRVLDAGASWNSGPTGRFLPREPAR
jgi:polyribonucleotide nucleotidyltransferase